MSKPVSPVAIGGFALGALALLIIGIFVFGGARYMHSDKIDFVVFFDSSLNGLEVGAPVKMQGVKIGTVTKIVLQIDPDTAKVYKPVVVEIDRNSFVGASGQSFAKASSREDQEMNRNKLVEAGFRARLEMQSLLTGLLYINLDLYPDKTPQFVGLEYQGLLEFPAIPTTADELRNTADEVAKMIRALPLDQIVQDFAQTLREIRDLLGSEDVRKSRIALANTLADMEKAVATLNVNLGPILRNSNQAIGNANALLRDVRGEVKPLLAASQQTLTAATAALDKAAAAVVTMDGSVGPESTLNETLLAFKEAARSLRDLTDYLQQHPEALISGKDH